jgi:peptide-methionine (S)-S-oxide reductase
MLRLHQQFEGDWKMNRLGILLVGLLVAALVLFATMNNNGVSVVTKLPDPSVDETVAGKQGKETIVLAGGCFWGLQAVFQHVNGVSRVTSGYSGGAVKNPDYEEVSSGSTGHAESVEIVYEPSKVTLGQLLKVFFSVAHNPTELNRQGPDTGTQYRSAIFFGNAEQERIAAAYVSQLNKAKLFSGPIVTEVSPAHGFYAAEGYHQNYAALHPGNPYIAQNDLPKVKNLEKEFPRLYRAEAADVK